jgi:hypothetical protein
MYVTESTIANVRIELPNGKCESFKAVKAKYNIIQKVYLNAVKIVEDKESNSACCIMPSGAKYYIMYY